MTLSTWDAVTNRLVAQIQTVADVGLVYKGIRLITSEADLHDIAITRVAGEDRIRMWWVHLESMEDSFADASGSLKWNRRSVVEGFLQWEAGASEKTGLSLAESICRTLATDLRATKLNSTVLSGAPPAIEANEPRILAMVLVHYVRLTMPLLTIEQ